MVTVGTVETDDEAIAAALVATPATRGQASPPVQPGMESLQCTQVTARVPGMSETQVSEKTTRSSAPERRVRRVAPPQQLIARANSEGIVPSIRVQ